MLNPSKMQIVKLVNVKEKETPPIKTYSFPNSDILNYIKTAEYKDQLRDPRWLQKREEILRRDNYQCRNCGSTANLEVHHRQYHYSSKLKRFNKVWEYNNQFLITLCRTCHQLGHQHYKVKVFIY
ncbi:MAG: hypothetical protein KatS3mg027_2339 [Bacteroidia bacterium]|nr:MAG: hypothetical protein KatS3mg027_2339 [Bacteroidia bacterium]